MALSWSPEALLSAGADSAIWGRFCNLRGGFYNLNIGQKECFTDCRICPKRLHNSPLRLHNPPYRLHNPPLRLQIPPLPADCIIRPFFKGQFSDCIFCPKRLQNPPLRLQNPPKIAESAPAERNPSGIISRLFQLSRVGWVDYLDFARRRLFISSQRDHSYCPKQI